MSADASAIDGGTASYDLSGWLGGYGSQNDRVALVATFLNSSGASLGTTQIGPVTNTDRGNVTEFLQRTATGSIPVGTRQIKLDLDFTWTAGQTTDGYADNLSLTITPSIPAPALTPPPSTVPAFDHVFRVYMENNNFSSSSNTVDGDAEIIGNSQAPYINGLANQNTLLTNYTAITHNSAPNYVAIAGGSTFGHTAGSGGLASNCITTCTFNVPSLGDRVDQAGKTWKQYADGANGNCDTSQHGYYYPDDVPFYYFPTMKNSLSYCQAHWQPLTRMFTDLQSTATTPNFVWFDADDCNDMEACGIAAGDTWLSNTLPKLFSSPAWAHPTLAPDHHLGRGRQQLSRRVWTRPDQSGRDHRHRLREHGRDRLPLDGALRPLHSTTCSTDVEVGRVGTDAGWSRKTGLSRISSRGVSCALAMPDLATLDLIGHADLVRSGEATALELLDAAIARIESTRELNAVICDLFDRARARAAEPLSEGPLAGAPFLLKDLGAALEGVPERMGSVALRGYVSPRSSVVVSRYEAAGLLIAGKTNTPEWGNHCTTEPVLFGPTLNPRAPDRSPGGSSGGSAVAVAAGLVPAASGGDGTGSIRVPASSCGVIGLKPARGRKTFAPDGGHGLEGLVNEHALTRSVRDCAALLDATAGRVPGDPYSAPPPAGPWSAAIERDPVPLRVRWTADGPFAGDTHPETRAAVEATAGVLAELGHDVEHGAPAFDPEPVVDAVAVLHEVSNLELYALAAEVLGRAPTHDELEATAWEMLEEGRGVTGERYAGAITTAHAQGRRFAEGLADVDVFVVPTLLTGGPPPLAHLNQPRGSTAEFFRVEFATTGWTPMANVSGFAAVSLPLGTTSEGLPIGVQFMAPEETVLLQLAAQLERAGRFERVAQS
ncbi:MAG TPA: amidase family protein [Solirubrobacteraceae bacterium]|nr:amidase family protein [Solirubrobacteraceae bacterium]